MENKKVISLDNDLLKTLKESFEHSLDLMIKNALIINRDTEVNVKVLISTAREISADGELYTSPKIQYKVTEKIKEPKADYKGFLDQNYSISLDDENNIIIKNVDEQQSLFLEGSDEKDNDSRRNKCKDN